ncbi:hypothetical protein BAS09_03850 [Elizabethkingia ursingii]|uniref:FISUMP domain-containing protein n=1 Tax=Elizabethkingia ursingii TaxID=1756150 RepID=UPI00099A3F9A|nr:FISUMP domain-containing protein [Elizabethkingia ursingii]OPC04831.1 hypothetical protein BAS09_03850 [Elizabethkingia ursingii]
MKPKLPISNTILFILSLNIISCRSSDTEHSISNQQASVKVNFSGTEFENAGNIETQASTKPNISGETLAQRTDIPFGADLTLTAVLTPEGPTKSEKAVASSTKINPMAETEQENIANNIKYKIVVFDANGTYITERDYTHGQEVNTTAINLDGGSSYTFIAYSIGSTSDLPSVTYSDSANKTLSTASITNLDGNKDLMYFRKDMQLNDGDNNLDVVLRHKISEITTTFSSSATGYNVSEIDAGFSSHYPNSDLKLSDASIIRKGSVGDAKVTFSGLNSMNLSAPARFINADTQTGSFDITKITIGTITKNNISLFNNLKITPGIKYNLNINITANDIFLTYQGRPSVRINGKIWMRHNLGVDTSLNPDVDPYNKNLHGNFYQFGRSNIVANASTSPDPINGWNTNAAPYGSWNSGTETNPAKTANDPCPSGWRVPTRGEFEQLITDTEQKGIGGTWATNDTQGQNNFAPAKTFTSRRNKSVTITFPAAGYRNSPDGRLYWRAGVGHYWSSSASSGQNNLPRLFFIENDTYISSSTTSNFSPTTGLPVRCIAQ